MISIIDRLERIEARADALSKGLHALAGARENGSLLFIKTGPLDPPAYPLVHQAVGDCFVGKGCIQALNGSLQNIEAVIKALGKAGIAIESISVRSRLEVDDGCTFVSDRSYRLDSYMSS